MSRELTLLPSVPLALKALDGLEREIANAPTFERLEAAANKAAGLQREFKSVEAVATRAGKAWVAAEVKVRFELDKIERAKPSGANQHQERSRNRTDPPTYAEMGIKKKRAARAKKLAEIPEEKRKQYIDELVADGKGVTPNGVLAKQRQEAKTTKKHEVATATFSADGPFDVVVIDPPWPMQKIDRDVRPNQDAFDYPTMDLDELGAFWKKEMPPRLKPDCHLFVWTTQKFLPEAFSFIDAVGFRYVLGFVWHKSGGFQPIGLPQYNCEFVIYARQGTPVFIDTKSFMCCFEAPRREHSRKPDFFYEMVRRVTGGSRIDIFSREARDGFAQFGNELRKFKEVA